LTAAIFLATYAVIAAGRAPFLRIDRTGAAIVGAVLMVVTGAISFTEAVQSVDFRTIVLLFGMMIIVAHLRLAGGIAAVARAIGGGVQSRVRLLFALVFAAGLLSALFVNDTICLVFTPLVLDLAAARRERPAPYLLALATASNIGSVATITGNPQNMLIGSVSGIAFTRFAAALAPVAVAGLAVDGLIIWALFRRELATESTAVAGLPRIRAHRPLLVKTLVVIAGVLAAFLAGFDSALVAVAGAAALLVTRRVRPRKIYAAIDWDLLMLFAGLFVVVGAGERAGFDRRLFEWLRPLGVQTVAGLSATAAILSNAISNVPAVMLFTRIVPRLPHPDRAWLTLAMSSTLAGNLTVLGSIANLIVIESARRRGIRISFAEYARVGVPVTIVTILVGVLWLARLGG
jgi:Na+/H+ antiporter NhaD/arsenite permease-like protein